MSWTCTLAPNTGEPTTTNHKSVTGARRSAVNMLLAEANGILQDEAAWAPRTQRSLRADVTNLVALATDVSRYDGPTSISYVRGSIALRQHQDAATNGRQPTVSKTEARWLASSKFEQACPSCSGKVEPGSRAWYDPKVGLYHEGCAPAGAPR